MSKAIAGKAKEVSTLDLRKEFKHLYQPPAREALVVDVPILQFLMIDGVGNPNTAQQYQDAVNALYSLAFTLKFLVKKELVVDYPVMPLEGLWWTADMRTFRLENKDDWQWTMMIMQPEIVTSILLSKALAQAEQKKGLPALSQIRLERFEEGRSAQIMHLGPYATEKPTIEKLHLFIQEHGYSLRGKHHEIYLGDPRKSKPDKLRTVIRQPIA